jgi:carboxyl-terminal processing protease
MRHSRTARLTALALLLLASLAPPLWPGLGAPPASGQANSRTFPETGMTAQGKFLAYWNSHGGLAQQGYPISSEMQERSDTDGKTYTVQYFERAVFEAHPENKAPYDVLLSLLGSFTYKQKYPNGAPNQAANGGSGSMTFPQTGKTAGGLFLAYWKSHGGLAQQGYPISNEFQEKSDTDGKTYTVQYFERAVFEYHPENQAPYNLLLSQLGTARFKAAYATQHLDTFEQVWGLVRDQYVYTDFRGLNWQAVHDEYAAKLKAANGDDAAYAVIADMVQKLNDGHSGFETPQEAKEDDALQRGDLKLSGIGVITQWVNKSVRIEYVIPGSPADHAGLRPFDVIRAVNGTPLTNINDAPHLIRGAAGTQVTLTIESPGKPTRDVSLVRADVTFTFHATAHRLPGSNVGFLDLPTFYQFGIAGEVKQELQKLAAAGPLDGLVINLRQNGGGFLSELVDTEKLFLDGGNAGYEATRTARTADIVPSGSTLSALRGKPIVVLVSNSCESACERFSVAMHDLSRAKILGTTTAGNTETVQPYDLNDGSRLSLAVATFQRPDGSSIEDKGMVPDVTMDVPWYEHPVDEDPQVLAAEALIQGK